MSGLHIDPSIKSDVLHYLFDTLNARRHYQFLLKTKPTVRNAFFKRLSEVDRMDDLMRAVLQSGWCVLTPCVDDNGVDMFCQLRTNVAKDLAQAYFENRIADRPANYDEIGKDELLELFLEKHGIEVSGTGCFGH
ncbi:hypothetical protein M427DRAFT_348716 [Gonapodya prolifera JEL478]|uniref:Uncharacterized protein n=1 Tax=Gonapodya prolifera (strain JEL478) TaxID=1344416 RepID=A0A139AW36_GONPJ|nr:hypothetical protein M427DRAFT_348716 [Gonapodya prolifera JEL478]|eukprot:KXS20914.1 hypothetical protein M427DRAFT_348716 [Gonapodya prolifera JEL478]